MQVSIDQAFCTGDGLSEEIVPDVFVLLGDGLAYVCEGDTVHANAKGNPQGADDVATVPDFRRGLEAAAISFLEDMALVTGSGV